MLNAKILSPKESVLHYFTQYPTTDTPIVVCVSGGVDSMVLLHILTQTLPSKQLIVAHVHHNTRAACDNEKLLIENTCKAHNIMFEWTKLEHVPASNKEQYWRRERQKFYAAVRGRYNADRYITAHHATDLIETLLYRVIKGATERGLSPMDPSTKPLLRTTKQALYDYAEAHMVDFLEDDSNEDMTYARNNIRQKILPVARIITPHIEPVAVRTQAYFSLLDDYITTKVQPYITPQAIPLREFLALHEFLQYAFIMHISGTSSSLREAEDALRWLTNTPAGNTEKSVGNALLRLKNNILSWHKK